MGNGKEGREVWWWRVVGDGAWSDGVMGIFVYLGLYFTVKLKVSVFRSTM